MSDLSDSKRGQIVGARMAGDSVRKPADLFCIVRSTVLRVMTASEKEEKNLLTEAKLWKVKAV